MSVFYECDLCLKLLTHKRIRLFIEDVKYPNTPIHLCGYCTVKIRSTIINETKKKQLEDLINKLGKTK